MVNIRTPHQLQAGVDRTVYGLLCQYRILIMKSRKSIMSIKTIVVTFLISAATCVVAQTNRIPGAVHTDLYDKTDVIPLDEIAWFYMTYLK